MTHEEIRELTLDQLIEGRDLEGWRPEARQFLSDLMDAADTRELRLIALPIARRLLGCEGWQDHLTIAAVAEFCRPRAWVCQMLNDIPHEMTHDAGADYMVGLAAGLYGDLWGKHLFA